MTDVLTPEQRRRCMSNIRGRDTKPEMAVRRLIHRLGFRYRLHYERLPGKPDLAFPRFKKVVFVHGCFWHKHKCKYGQVKPSTNVEFWENKRNKTVERDGRIQKQLSALGWESLVIWECWIHDEEFLKKKLLTFFT